MCNMALGAKRIINQLIGPWFFLFLKPSFNTWHSGSFPLLPINFKMSKILVGSIHA